MTATFDVAIIGGGIAGLSLGAHLCDAAKVVVLERESHLAFHTSGRSAAIYIPSYGSPTGKLLTQLSGDLFENLPDEFFSSPALTRNRGVICLARSKDDPHLKEMLDTNVVKPITMEDVLSRVPILNLDGYEAATFEELAKDIDVDALLSGFRRQFLAGGGTIMTDREVTGLHRGNDAWSITTAAETIESAIVVNAAGAWADQVAGLAGLAPVGMRPLKRTGIIVPPPEGHDIAMWPTVYDVAAPVYFKPDAGRIMLSPADETLCDPHDAFSDDMDVAVAVDRLQSMVTYQITRVEHSWAGLRTFSADDEPVAGYDPGADGFFWFAGQGGFGIQMSPAYARLARTLLLRETMPEFLAASPLQVDNILPDRFR